MDSKKHLTLPLILNVLAALSGSFITGYNLGVLNALEKTIKVFLAGAWHERYQEAIPAGTLINLWVATVTIFVVGGMIGSFLVGRLADGIGRRNSMLAANALAVVSALFMGLSGKVVSWEMLIAGRFVVGLYCGLTSGLVPMYIGEIAPTAVRGILGSLHQLAIVTSILLAQVLGLTHAWELLLGLMVVPAVLQLAAPVAGVFTESPRFLLINRRQEGEARAVLERLRGPEADVSADMAEMEEEHRQMTSEKRVGLVELLRSPALRWPLCIAVTMNLAQQLSGINAVIFYSTGLFEGMVARPVYATIAVGAVNLAFTVVSMALVERAGRRLLMMIGLLGMAASSLMIIVALDRLVQLPWMAYVGVAAVLSFVAFFEIGPGPIPFFITAEIFSQGPRPNAMSVAGFSNWAANLAVSIGFPYMKERWGPFVFLIFMGLLAVFAIFTYFVVPETKGRSIDEITSEFRRKAEEGGIPRHEEEASSV